LAENLLFARVTKYKFKKKRSRFVPISPSVQFLGAFMKREKSKNISNIAPLSSLP